MQTKISKSKIPIPVHSPEIVTFNGYLDALSLILVGENYVTQFESKAFDLPNAHLPTGKILLMAYPNSKPEEAKLRDFSLEMLLEETESCFSYPSSLLMESDATGVILGNLRAGFWRHLKNCIDYENAAIYSYNPQVVPYRFDIFWDFSWLIYNKEQRRCVLLYGGSSD